MKIFTKYKNLTIEERRLFRYSLRILLFAWWKTTFFPMRKYITGLGENDRESSMDALTGDSAYLLKLKSSIKRASRYAPFKTKCLQQAYAAKIILNKQKIPSTIYFGATKNNRNKLVAHAWLRAGNIIITGEKEYKHYVVVAKIS